MFLLMQICMGLNGQSYGHAYLSSYGWEGTGKALREGAIDKPLAVLPKKDLSGLGKDRDEAFPFWDHLFTAASNAITIKVSNDDGDTSDSEVDASRLTDANSGSLSLKRTTTGIISNRRPVTGTPASTTPSVSGTTTPNPNACVTTVSRLSLVAAAKREGAKRGLYSRFFRGPVLGPDDDPSVESAFATPSTTTSTAESDSLSLSTPEQTDEPANSTETTKKSRKRKSEDREETKEERRERKRLKKERKATKAAKKAKKAEREWAKERRDGSQNPDCKVRKRRDNDARLSSQEERSTSPTPKKSHKPNRESADGTGGPAFTETTRKKLKNESTSTDEKKASRIPPIDNQTPSDGLSVVLTTRKKKGKRKDTTAS